MRFRTTSGWDLKYNLNTEQPTQAPPLRPAETLGSRLLGPPFIGHTYKMRCDSLYPTHASLIQKIYYFFLLLIHKQDGEQGERERGEMKGSLPASYCPRSVSLLFVLFFFRWLSNERP